MDILTPSQMVTLAELVMNTEELEQFRNTPDEQKLTITMPTSMRLASFVVGLTPLLASLMVYSVLPPVGRKRTSELQYPLKYREIFR